MKDNWEERISCAIECCKCAKKLNPEDNRILSVYDHQAIAWTAKRKKNNDPIMTSSLNRLSAGVWPKRNCYTETPKGIVIITFIHIPVRTSRSDIPFLIHD